MLAWWQVILLWFALNIFKWIGWGVLLRFLSSLLQRAAKNMMGGLMKDETSQGKPGPMEV